MNTLQRGMINLLKSAITGQACPLPADFDLEAAYPQLRHHQIDTLLFEGAVRCGIPRELPIMRQLMQKYCAVLLKSEGQIRDLNRVTAAFEENGIDYMLLKGSRMKKLYPKQELRNMSDADILIRMEQYDQIKSVMQSLGFACERESDHEFIWRTKSLFLELHKRLLPSYNKVFYAYFGDGWCRAVPEDGCSHIMRPEDEFIYLFTHYAKHFRGGGIGCRHVVDLWVYLRANPSMDMKYIRTELAKMHLLEFYENTCAILSTWFDDREADDKVRFMTDYIFASGSYGREDLRILTGAIRESESKTGVEGKFRYAIGLLFPGVMSLRDAYPILHKAPWMLPAVWIYRLFYKFLWERKKFIHHKNKLKSITTENMSEHKQLLNYMGLDYNF